MNIPQILKRLSQLFEECLTSEGPCLLLLDNLDVCCPNPNPHPHPDSHQSTSHPSSQASNADILRDERFILITSLLQQKLQAVDTYRKRKQLQAKALFQTFYLDNNNQDNRESDSLAREEYNKDIVLSQYLQSQVVIISTSQSLHSLDPMLLGTTLSTYSYYGASFHRYFSLPRRIPPTTIPSCPSSSSPEPSLQQMINHDNRWKVLLFYLEKENIPFCPTSDTSTAADEIIAYLINFRYGDYPHLLSLIKYEISLRLFDQYHIRVESPPRSPPHPPSPANRSHKAVRRDGEEASYVGATLTDVLKAFQRYIPIQTKFSASQGVVKSYRSNQSASHQGRHFQIRLERSIALLQQSSYFQALTEQILEIVYYPTVYARLYQSVPIRLPKAIMLFGLPGCGKTFLAQTIGNYYFGGEESHQFYTIKGPQLLNKYIGESEKAIRELFQVARQSQPVFAMNDKGRTSSVPERGRRGVLLFFDEFEALAPKRGKDNTGITDRIVNQLLTFIDGVESTLSATNRERKDEDRKIDDNDEEDDEESQASNNIFIMIGTSRPDLIDAALLRPGRIETHLYLSLPQSRQQYRELLESMMSPYLPHRVRDCHRYEEAIRMIDRISETKSITDFTMADLQAMIDTAYLKAVHQQLEVELERSTETEMDEVQVAVDASILWQAFEETKPSLQAQDRQFYEHLYAPFVAKHSQKTLPSSSTRPSHVKPSSASLYRLDHNGREKAEDIAKNTTSVYNCGKEVDQLDGDGDNDVDRFQKLSFR